METPPVATMLLAEDNPDDVRMFQEALLSAGLETALVCVGNGQEALDYLRRRGPFAAAPRPDVLVLDLNLPVLDGRGVLVELAADDTLNTLPVFILTGSRYDGGAQALYRPDRCRFAAKPRRFTELVELVRQVAGFASSLRSPACPGSPT